MIKKALAKVIKFAESIKKIYIIIRDNKYWQPKIMTINNSLEYLSGVQVSITGNFNAETITSIWENGHITIILWNKGLNKGYQLVGIPVKIDILSINPLPQNQVHPPKGVQALKLNQNLSLQVERRIYFNVEQIIEFDSNAESLQETDWDEMWEEIEDESLINF